jgi:hypothetical protein
MPFLSQNKTRSVALVFPRWKPLDGEVRVALMVSILQGETSVQKAARTHGLTVAES